MRKQSLWYQAINDTLPILTGYLVLGFGFGVLLVSNKLPLWLAPLMSVTVYAGAMQYLAVDLLVIQAGYLDITLATLLVNARHFLYGLSLLEKYEHTGWKKIILCFGLTDETYSLIVAKNRSPEEKDYYFYVTVLNHVYWIAGTILGALTGTLLPFDAAGLDFTMTSMFIVIFTEQWLTQQSHFSATLGISASLICLWIFGAKNFLIASMLVIVCVLLFVQYRERRFL